MRRLISAAMLVGAFLLPRAAAAQDPSPQPLPQEPIRGFVIDARGVMARFKNAATTAEGLGVNVADLPTRGFGLAIGAHVYPLRRGGLALGVGAEWLLRARGTRTQSSTSENSEGPVSVTRLSNISPQVSLNFGRRDGWSYVSAGIGGASFVSEVESDPGAEGTRRRAINYGGGARWFATRHVAFTFDIRLYAVSALAADATRPAMPSTRLMVLSAGISAR